MPDISTKEKKKEYDRVYRVKNHDRRQKQNKDYYVSVRRKQFIENPSLYLWKVAKVRAKKFNIEFSISPNDVIIPDTCPIIGCILVKGDGHRQDAPSLDRINNDLGYIPGNVRVISRFANLKKSSLTEDLLCKLLQYIRGEI